MPNFPVGARVVIDQCEGKVVGNDGNVVLVQIPGVCEAGRFNPKFVHLVDERAMPVVDSELRDRLAEVLRNPPPFAPVEVELAAVAAASFAPVLAERDKELIAREAQIRDLTRELDLAVATRQQYQEERDVAIAKRDMFSELVKLRTGTVGLHRQEIERLRAELDAFRHLLGCIWLYVDWRYVTRQLTTEQKNTWADAVDAFGDPALNVRGKADRWWQPVTEASEQTEECKPSTVSVESAGEIERERSVSPATPAEPRVWHKWSQQPDDVWKVRDKHGDVWTRNVADSWQSPGAMPCGWPYMAKKWAPLTEVVDQPGGDQ